MSIASRIEAIEQHLTDDYSVLEVAGADLTNVNKNILNLKTTWQERLLYFMNNGTDVVWNNWDKVTGEGTSISLNNTLEGKMKIELKGNTSQATSTLPSEYTQVDYIQSTGAQYIDTGVKLSSDYGFDIKFLTNNNLSTTTGYGCIFGGRNGSGIKDYQLTTFGASPYVGTLRWGYASGTGTASADITLNTVQQCSLKNKTFTSCNGTVTQLTTTVEQSNYNCFLFGLNNGTSGFSQSGNGCRIYYCKFYDGNNLIRNFIPCYRNSDNEVGLYDLVNNVFYTNAGSGTFTYGSVATLPKQDIHVVSGDNSINVCGKNLFEPFQNGSITGQQEATTSITNIKQTYNYTRVLTFNNREITGYPRVGNGSYYIFNLTHKNLKPNTAYTISLDYDFTNLTGTTGNLIIYGYLVTAPSGQTSISGKLVKTFTTNANGEFVLNSTFLNIAMACCNENTFMKLSNIMLVEGQYTSTTIPDYEAYKGASYPISLGDMELCKIGDYQDYIYKDSGKWYKYNAIGKKVLDGSEVWAVHGGIASWFYYDGIIDGYVLDNTQVLIKTNYYTPKAYQGVPNLVNGECSYGSSDGGITHRFVIKNTDYTQVQDFKNWLSTHNTIVYYALSTPTTTEITDSTLLSQLEALEKGKSYTSQTNISQNNDDLPFIINATALEEMS